MRGKLVAQRLESNPTKIKTESELKELLLGYKTILSNPMYDYLSEIINLDISAIKDYITPEERELLAQLDIYKDAAKYNIFNRTLELIGKNRKEIGDMSIRNENSCLTVSLNAAPFCQLFTFNYVDNLFGKSISDEASKRIGSVTLFKTVDASYLDEAEIKDIESDANKLAQECNPYSCGYRTSLSYQWKIEHREKITKYRKFLEDIHDNSHLTDLDKRRIEVTKYVSDLLFEDYGLTESLFDPQPVYEKDYYGKQFSLTKVYSKKMPYLVIRDEITHI